LFDQGQFLCGEASSRNSGVVHSGIHYQKGSLKSRLCQEGKDSLYDFCERNKVPFKKTGKLIIAANKEEEIELAKLIQNAVENDVPAELYSRGEIKKSEPNIEASSAIYCPTTGILNVSEFIVALIRECARKGVQLFSNTKVTNLKKTGDKLTVATDKRGSEDFGIVINAAGLYSDEIYRMLNPDSQYEIVPVRGEYFEVKGKKAELVSKPVYPIPNSTFLGIHLTPTFGDTLLIGPSSKQISSKTDYIRGRLSIKFFYEAIRTFFPAVNIEDLSESYAGIRAKLKGENDFVIKQSPKNVVHLLGIDSPGLTSCFAVAKKVKHMIS
jgi:glycerol-3-phosphate dehydrogenase